MIGVHFCVRDFRGKSQHVEEIPDVPVGASQLELVGIPVCYRLSTAVVQNPLQDGWAGLGAGDTFNFGSKLYIRHEGQMKT